MRSRRHTVIGACGLGYVVGAAVENMGLLDAPLLGASETEIRAAHADHVLGVVGTACGALSLLLYVAFTVLLCRRWAWAAATGAALAFVGVAANVAMLAGEPTRELSELALTARYLAGPCMAIFLAAVAGRRWAVPLALTPLALTGVDALQVAAIVAFGVHSLWIWQYSLRALCGGAGRVASIRRAAFLMLVVAAGAVGVALLAVPAATATFFAWGLRPAPLAAFAGGVYVGSAALYAAALRSGARDARPLVLGAVVLSVSVLAITLVHLDVFDLTRLQAWAWLVLFAGFGLVTCALAVLDRPEARPLDPLPAISRSAFAVVSLALVAAAIALWADPAAFDLPPLGGRFAGSWAALLATLVGWAAWRNDRGEARLPALALVALPAGALIAAVRVGAADAVVVGYLALLVAGVLAVRALAPTGRGSEGARHRALPLSPEV